MPARTTRLRRRLRVAHLGVVGHFRGHRLGRLGGGVRHLVAGLRGLFGLALGVLGLGALAFLAGVVLLLVLVAFLALLLVGIGGAVLAHVEAVEQIVDGVAEARLLVDQLLQLVEILAGLVLDAAGARDRPGAGPPAAASCR